MTANVANASASLPAPARLPPQAPAIDIQRDRHTTTIQVEKWTITTTKKPILNIKEVEAAEKALNMPLPEMTFGNNHLNLSYKPAPTSSKGASSPASSGSEDTGNGVQICWKALDALAEVGVGEGWEERVGGGVQVSMAEKWGKNRSNPSALLTDVPLPTTPVKPHDWTYSTTYTGSVAGPSRFQPTSTHGIPMKLLARQDPVLDRIMFYEDVPLFEDELHDNGESILNARIRIMPHSFFILARLFLRVDNVLFRLFDARVYHEFGSGEVLRDVSGMEAEYENVKAMLDKPSDLSPLTDPNFVQRAMTHLSTRPEAERTSTRGGKPWPGLGRRVEVLRLPDYLGLDQVEAGVGGMGIS